METLRENFEPKSKITMYCVKFKAIGCKKDETWGDFADELWILADKAPLTLRTRKKNW